METNTAAATVTVLEIVLQNVNLNYELLLAIMHLNRQFRGTFNSHFFLRRTIKSMLGLGREGEERLPMEMESLEEEHSIAAGLHLWLFDKNRSSSSSLAFCKFANKNEEVWKAYGRLIKKRVPELISNFIEYAESDDVDEVIECLHPNLEDPTAVSAAGEEEKEIDLSVATSSLPDTIGILSHCRTLDLNTNVIERIPYAIGFMTSLTRLNIRDNALESLPESIGRLINLERLNLSENMIKKLPESFGNLTKLSRLNIATNILDSLPQSFGSLLNLTFLELDSNLLTSLPSSFGNLTSLMHLNLEKNALMDLPSSISNLNQLQELFLEGNKFNVIPDYFAEMESLITLNLAHNEFSNLPSALPANILALSLSGNKNLTNFNGLDTIFMPQSIYLADCNLSEIPVALTNFLSLTSLDLSGNKLVMLPSGIGNLVNLRTLNLNNNRLEVVTEGIGMLANLTLLSLDYNFLTFLPATLPPLLEFLNVSFNMLESLPESIGLACPSLRFLKMQNNRIPSFPESFTLLSGLVNLTANDNAILQLPGDFQNLTALTVLDLHSNNLKTLPESLPGSLQDLNLAANELTNFLNEFSYLTQLKRLDLSNNRISALSESIGKLRNLVTLNISFNLFESLPRSLSKLKYSLEILSTISNPLTKLTKGSKSFLQAMEFPDDEEEYNSD